MKRLMSLMAVGVVVATATTAFAAKKQAQPFGEPGPILFGQAVPISQPPAPEGHAPMASPEPLMGGPVALYHCVRVKDPHHIAPCAVPLVIQVKDPCACNNPCNCCAPQCVNVQICVPTSCCPPRIVCRKDGGYVKYDYGKYRIEVTSRNGVVTVDYDD